MNYLYATLCMNYVSSENLYSCNICIDMTDIITMLNICINKTEDQDR